MSNPEQQQTNNDTPSKASLWFSDRWAELKLTSKTVIALVFIVNSMALGLMALGLVSPTKFTASIFGSIAIAFAVVVLGTFVHQGVKFQSTTKRKK